MLCPSIGRAGEMIEYKRESGPQSPAGWRQEIGGMASVGNSHQDCRALHPLDAVLSQGCSMIDFGRGHPVAPAVRAHRALSLLVRAAHPGLVDDSRDHGGRVCHDRPRDLEAHDQFWGVLFGINFAMGVATGITMEFQFGTNWAYYAHYVGDIFGVPLAIEGLMAFFLESTFVGLFFFGWNGCPSSRISWSRAWSRWGRASRRCGFWWPTAGCRIPSGRSSTLRPCAWSSPPSVPCCSTRWRRRNSFTPWRRAMS